MDNIFNGGQAFNNGGSPSISGWTTSGVTTMLGAFRSNYVFNQDIGGWDVSNVTDISYMFSAAQSFNQDIGDWDVSSVTNMRDAFTNASSFNNSGSPSISGWTTSGVTTLYRTFNGATTFNQPIGSWDTSNVNTMYRTFNSAAIFDKPIGNWNVSGVTNMSDMLSNGSMSVVNYNDVLTGWTGWDAIGSSATTILNVGVNFGAGFNNYSTGSTAEDARGYLVSGLTWTISDGGGI